MIASLPMYDRPETRAANIQLWEHVKEALGTATPELTHPDEPLADWLNPGLLLSQTCGMPYRKRLHSAVNLVASPVHSIDAPPGQYYSVVITRKSDNRQSISNFENAPLAVNDLLSQSGYSAPMTLAADNGFEFQNIRHSGAHRASAQMVADGRADIAAIDVVTWEMIKRWDDLAGNLRELTTTPPSPALPYITARSQSPDPIRLALSSAIATLSQDERTTLLLEGVTYIPPDNYLAVRSVV